MKNNIFQLFLSQNIHIIKWINLILICAIILTGGIILSYIDYQLNYPTEEEISMYTDISYCIWEDGLKAASFNNCTIENNSCTYSNNDLFYFGLSNADLNNINLNLVFDNFTLKNCFSKKFLIKPNNITNIYLNIYPDTGITCVYSDFNIIKSKMKIIITIFLSLIFTICIYTIIKYIKFKKQIKA